VGFVRLCGSWVSHSVVGASFVSRGSRDGSVGSLVLGDGRALGGPDMRIR
jgi:hypothetical protein